MGKWSKQARARQSARLSGYWKAKRENGQKLFNEDTKTSAPTTATFALESKVSITDELDAIITHLTDIKKRIGG